MSARKPEDERIALLQRTLDLLILRTLLFGKEHGQGIAHAIQSMSGDELLVDHGSLYPALQRLEANGWVHGEWGASGNNRRRDSTGSRQPGKSNSHPKRKDGSGLPPLWGGVLAAENRAG